MLKSERVKPQFGREMVPCEYKSKWANKLPKEEVVVIKAESTRMKSEESRDDR